MSNASDVVLKQKVEKVGIILKQKRVLVKSSVVFLMDVSGSAEELYRSGVMQATMEEILPVALNLDDNGELDVFIFQNDDNFMELPSVLASNYGSYVDREIMRNSDVPKWGGTDFAPVLKAVLTKYGLYQVGKKGGLFGLGKKEEKYNQFSNAGYPVTVYLVTDGENYDEDRTEDIFRSCQMAGSNVYFNCIGVGDQSFKFLRRVAGKYDNVGFWKVEDLAGKIASGEIYDILLPDELLRWLRGGDK